MLESQWIHTRLHLPCWSIKAWINYMTGWVVATLWSSFGLWTYTQLNVYTWMYLSWTVSVIFVKSKKERKRKKWAKQGRKFLPFTSTIWSPPSSPTQTPGFTHMPDTQTHTHVHKVIKCPTRTVPETIFKSCQWTNETPTFSRDKENWCKDGFLFTMDVPPLISLRCVPFHAFCDGCKLCLPVSSYINQMFHQWSWLAGEK